MENTFLPSVDLMIDNQIKIVNAIQSQLLVTDLNDHDKVLALTQALSFSVNSYHELIGMDLIEGYETADE